MTDLIQHKYPAFSHMISKLDTTTVVLNTDLIKKDIERFEEALNKSKRYNKANIKAIVAYLKKLLKTLNDDSTLELAWSIDKKTELPKSYPIKLVCEDVYKINVCNYIELEPGNKLVDIELKEMANIIAFEFMCKDLGETHETIEDTLSECGVTTVEDSDILAKYMDTVSPNVSLYELSKTYKVEDSPYHIREEGSMQDYFGTTIFRSNSYREVVAYSCEYASTVILNSIFKEASKARLNLRVLSIDADRVQFEIKDCSDEFIRDTLIGDITIRVFGRKFKLKNKVNIY